MDPATLVALIIVALTAIFFFVRSGGGGNDAESIAAGTTRQKVDGVVLVGCSGSGKTTIFHKICSGTVPVTVPSMAPAYQGASLPSGKSIQVHINRNKLILKAHGRASARNWNPSG